MISFVVRCCSLIMHVFINFSCSLLLCVFWYFAVIVIVSFVVGELNSTLFHHHFSPNHKFSSLKIVVYFVAVRYRLDLPVDYLFCCAFVDCCSLLLIQFQIPYRSFNSSPCIYLLDYPFPHHWHSDIGLDWIYVYM